MNLNLYNRLLAEVDKPSSEVSTTTQMQPASLTEDLAHKLYVSILGRVADNTGFNYWIKESKASSHIAISSFLQSREALSNLDNPLLSSLKSASALRISNVVSERNVSKFVETILQNMGGKELATKANVDKYTKSIIDDIGTPTATKETVEVVRDQIFDKLSKQVREIIDANSSNANLSNKVIVSKEAVRTLDNLKVNFPNVKEFNGKLLLTEVLVKLTNSVTKEDVTISKARSELSEVLSNPILRPGNEVSKYGGSGKSLLDLNKYLEIKAREAGNDPAKKSQSLDASNGNDVFVISEVFDVEPSGSNVYLKSLDARGGNDTLVITTDGITNKRAAVFKNFETIKLVGEGASSVNPDSYSSLNENVSLELLDYDNSNFRITETKEKETSYKVLSAPGNEKGKNSTLELETVSKANVNLLVQGVNNRIDASNVKGKLEISGERAIIKELEYAEAAEANFSGSGNISISKLKGASKIDASSLTGRLILNVDTAAENSPGLARGEIFAGKGINIVNIKANVKVDSGSGLRVFTESGNDVVSLNVSNGSRVNINTGEGNDRIVLNIEDKDSRVEVNGGKGDDLIQLSVSRDISNTKLNNLTIQGGEGIDTFVINSVFGAVTEGRSDKDKYNFEIADFQRGEKILVSQSLRDTYDISLAGVTVEGSDTYVKIGNLRIKLINYNANDTTLGGSPDFGYHV